MHITQFLIVSRTPDSGARMGYNLGLNSSQFIVITSLKDIETRLPEVAQGGFVTLDLEVPDNAVEIASRLRKYKLIQLSFSRLGNGLADNEVLKAIHDTLVSWKDNYANYHITPQFLSGAKYKLATILNSSGIDTNIYTFDVIGLVDHINIVPTSPEMEVLFQLMRKYDHS